MRNTPYPAGTQCVITWTVPGCSNTIGRVVSVRAKCLQGPEYDLNLRMCGSDKLGWPLGAMYQETDTPYTSGLPGDFSHGIPHPVGWMRPIDDGMTDEDRMIATIYRDAGLPVKVTEEDGA